MHSQLQTWTTWPWTGVTNRRTATPSPKADVYRALQDFAPISLDAMKDVALLRRVDTKYVMSQAQLYQALAHLAQDYRVLEIKGRRQHRYQTLYFDTPDLALYRQHHDGWRSRYKVRARAYVDSHLAFLEVKRKTNQNVTVKSRLQTPMLATGLAPYVDTFLCTHYPYAGEQLEQVLWNAFRRITLVSKHRVERLTLDVDVSFWWGRERVELPGVAIAEVKQEHFSLDSAFIAQMRALGVRPMHFSKYCIGVAMLHRQAKHNRFKPQLLHVDQVTKGKVQ
ncbi:MAG: polyphosphate polymerase domain-containing protein [Anaerolineae bacterium]|nr:polyphosphate polymerase domain-containing protein [Anaerolineae bacterium]